MELDLFIQDFVVSNKLLNSHVDWPTLVSRRFVEAGSSRKIFGFQRSNDPTVQQFAVGELLTLPDGDWFRISLRHDLPDVSNVTDLRFDCLRMLHANTHYRMDTEAAEGSLLVKLVTRNRGLCNIVFVIQTPTSSGVHPMLL